MNPYKKLVGERIRRRREELGFESQGRLADILHQLGAKAVDQSRISRWESGASLPSEKFEPFLLAALRMTRDQLFSQLEAHVPSKEEIQKAVSMKVAEKRAEYGADIPAQMNEIKEMIKELQKPVDISAIQLGREREIKSLTEDNEELRKQVHLLVQENEALKLTKEESGLLDVFRQGAPKVRGEIMKQVTRMVNFNKPKPSSLRLRKGPK